MNEQIQAIVGSCIRTPVEPEPVLVKEVRVLGGDELAIVCLTAAGAHRALRMPAASIPLQSVAIPQRAELFEPVSRCPGCDSCSSRAIHVHEITQLFWQVALLRCPICDLFYKADFPSSRLLSLIYDGAYVHFKPPQTDTNVFSSRIQRLGPPAGRHLDYGCGAGRFVQAAAQAGWDSMGCDPFLPEGCESERLRRGNILDPQVSRSLGTFDCISLWAVVEHLTRPAATLRALAQLLRAGGKMILNCPDPRSIAAQVYGAQWSRSLLIEHIVFLSARSIQHLARELDLEVAAVRRAGSPFPIGRSDVTLKNQGILQFPWPAPVVALPTAAPIIGSQPSPSSGEAADWRVRVKREVKKLPGKLSQRAIATRGVDELARKLIHLARVGDHIEVQLRRGV